MKELRPYQIQAKDAVYNAMKRNVTEVMVVMATGTGKTKCATSIIKPLGRVLWLTHRAELINQSAIALLSEECGIDKNLLESEIDKCGGIVQVLKTDTKNPTLLEVKNNIGLIKEDLLDTDKRITVASVQTIYKRLHLLDKNLFDVIVIDECHHASSMSWIASIRHFSCKLRLGLTATPFRAVDGLQLGDVFSEIVFEYTIAQGVSDGYLCKPDAIQVKTSADLDSVHTIAGDFNQKELTEQVNTPVRNNSIVNKYIEYATGRKFIAFCLDVEHVIDLHQCFNDKGVKTNFVVGDKKLSADRIKVVNDFKNDDQVLGLVNCEIATEGFDFPNIGCVILARPTKSKTIYLQSLGRGLRLKDEGFVSMFGQNCIILDIVDNTSKHRLVNTITLDKELPVEEKLFMSDEHKEMILEVQRKRSMSVKNKDKDIKVDLLQLPKIKLSNSIKMQEPASEGQLKWISREGYDIANINYTKKHCAQIIGALPAARWKLEILKEHKYDLSQGATNSEYEAVKKELAKKGIFIKDKQ